MPQQGTPYLVNLGTAGMVAHPNRWRSQAGEMLLAENVVVENDLVNKEPSSMYYDQLGVDQLKMTYSWANTSDALGLAVWYRAGAASFFPYASAWGTANGLPGPTWTLPIMNAIPAGAFHAVRIGRERGTQAATAMTDTQGNTYTKVYDVSALGMQGQIWVSVLTSALATTDSLIVTLGDPTAEVGLQGTVRGDILMPPVLASKQTANASAVKTLTVGPGHSHVYPLVGIGAIVCSATVIGSTVPAFPFDASLTWISGPPDFDIIIGETFRFYSPTVIVAQREWMSDVTNTPAGTVTVQAGYPTVNGSGTTFTTAFRPGDDIIIGGERQSVDHIVSDMQLVTIAPWESSQTNVAMLRRAGPVLVTVINDETATGIMYKETPQPSAGGAHGTIRGTQLTAALAKLRRGRFVVGGKENAALPRKLFYFNGVDPVQVLPGDSTTAAPIAKPAADWGTTQDASKQPINGIVHADCLWAFGNLNDPHRVYASTPDNHEDFTTTAAPAQPSINFRIASNVGQRLYGAAQFQGVLYLWKYPEGLFYVDDTPSDRLQWTYRIRSMALGCAPSPYAVLATDDDVIFCDSQGHFHLLSAVATLGGTRDSDITRALGLHVWTDQNVNVATLDRLVSVYDGDTKTAWFGLQSLQATGAGGNNDLVIRWDFSLVASGGPLRMTTARCWTPNALCLKRRGFTGHRNVLIAETGNAWFLQQSQYGERINRDVINGVDQSMGIATTVTLPELDYGDTAPPARPRRKAFRAMELIAQQTNNDNHPVTATVMVDGVYRQTLRYPQGINRRRLQPLQCGDGYAITTSVQTDGSVVGDVPLIGVIYYYDLLGNDQSRKS